MLDFDEIDLKLLKQLQHSEKNKALQTVFFVLRDTYFQNHMLTKFEI